MAANIEIREHSFKGGHPGLEGIDQGVVQVEEDGVQVARRPRSIWFQGNSPLQNSSLGASLRFEVIASSSQGTGWALRLASMTDLPAQSDHPVVEVYLITWRRLAFK